MSALPHVLSPRELTDGPGILPHWKCAYLTMAQQIYRCVHLVHPWSEVLDLCITGDERLRHIEANSAPKSGTAK